MSIKRISLAAAILFSLTACGSGGGSDNAKTNNDLANLTKQLTQANENLEQKEKEAQAAQEAKVKAEAALLAAKKPLTKAEIYQLAIRSGLSNSSAEELARDLVGKTKEEVSDAMILNTRISKILTLAQNYGYTEQEAKTFESANRDKSFDDLVNLLSKEATDKQNARAALIAELKQLALDKGLQEWEASNFAYNNASQGKDAALVELEKLVARNNFIKELTKLATEKGLSEWDASSFANNNVDNSREAALVALEALILPKQKEAMMLNYYKQHFSDNYYPRLDVLGFVERNKALTLEEFKTKLDELVSHKQRLTELASSQLLPFHFPPSYVGSFVGENILNSFEEAEINLANQLKNTNQGVATGFHSQQNKTLTREAISENDKETGRFITTEKYDDIYNQKYSVVAGQYFRQEKDVLQYRYDGTNTWYEPTVEKTEHYTLKSDSYIPQADRGLSTKEQQFPVGGKATYTGIAFDAKGQGTLTYNVDFGTKTGSGHIDGLDNLGRLTLEQGELYKSASTDAMRARGNVRADDWANIRQVNGEYSLGFYGPNAEEIAGKATLSESSYGLWDSENNTYLPATKSIMDNGVPRSNENTSGSYQPKQIEVGFGGTRGEIQK